MNDTTNPAKRKRSKYPLILLGIILVNAVAIALALWWLYGTLTNFEATTPATAIHRYFNRLSAGEYGVIDVESGFVPDAVNDWEDYHTYLQYLYGGIPEGARFRKVAASRDDDGQLYAVYSGDERLGEVILYENQAEDGGWRVCAPVTYGAAHSVTAPGHAIVTVNGTLQDAAGASSEAVPGFEDLPKPVAAPVLLTYQVLPGLQPPAIGITDPWGTPCRVEETGTHLQAEVALSGEMLAVYATRMEEVARAQSNYNTNDITLAELAGYFYPDTPYYTAMQNYTDRDWYLEHHPPTFRDIVVTDIVSHSETCFSGRIDFVTEVVLLEGTRTHELPASYRMFFVQFEGQWRLWGLRFL